MLSYGPPHPSSPPAPEEYRALYPLDEIELPPNVSAEYHEEARLRLHHYYAHGTALDKWVGDLMQTKPQDHLQKTGNDFRPPQSYIEEWGYELGIIMKFHTEWTIKYSYIPVKVVYKRINTLLSYRLFEKKILLLLKLEIKDVHFYYLEARKRPKFD